MACDPIRQSCPPGSGTVSTDNRPEAEPVFPGERINLQGWRRFVPASVRFSLAQLWGRSRANPAPTAPAAVESLLVIEVPAGSFEGLPSDAVETIQFLDRLGQSVPVGVRYPILDASERRAIAAHSARLGKPSGSIESTTFFGRHRNALLNVRRQLVDERESWQGVPFRGLVVGTGFDHPHQGRLRGEVPMPVTVFEWGAMLDNAGVDWELDVVDPNSEIASYFGELGSRDELTFVVFDNIKTRGPNAVPPDYPPRVFGRYARRINLPSPQVPELPQGATVAYEVTLPRSFLQRIHFHQGSVVHPLPRTDYRLVSYMNVQMYLGSSIVVPIPPKGDSPDVTNLLLNVVPDSWVNSDAFSRRPSEIFRGSPGVEPAIQFSPILFRVTAPLAERSYLERREGGGWRVVVPNISGSSGLSYRSSGVVAPRTLGGELLLAAGEGPGPVEFGTRFELEPVPREAARPVELPIFERDPMLP